MSDDEWSLEREGPPLDQFIGKMDRLYRSMDKVASGSAQSISSHVAKRAYANAPILTGKLRSTIMATPVRVTGVEQRLFSSRVIVGDDVYYAPLMFYYLYPYSILPESASYHLGPRSRMQPGTPEGGVGGLWTQRVINYHESEYWAQFTSAFDTLFFSGKVTPRLRFRD